ncbi:hypothetical protein MKEN_00780100 [Mycena kentingensis (nom. inval.)]|nr:hypothetical protein MKEN_00780100 [Mycena kentingensis (nom. inval.)]
MPASRSKKNKRSRKPTVDPDTIWEENYIHNTRPHHFIPCAPDTPGSTLAYAYDHALAGPEGPTARVPIPQTEFIIFLWSNWVAKIVGVWQYHLARADKPKVPLDLGDLGKKEGVYLAHLDGYKWDVEDKIGCKGSTTRCAPGGVTVGVQIGNLVYPTVAPFPPHPDGNDRSDQIQWGD